jgi:hypothetical protein
VYTYTTEETDTDGFHDNSVNTDRLTIPTGLGGVYLVTLNVLISGSGSSYYFPIIKVNGAGWSPFVGSSSTFERVSLSAIGVLNAGDYVTSVMQISTTGSFTTNRRFSIVRIGI